MLVNGVTIANLGDGSGDNTAQGKDAGITGGGVPGNQTDVWIRCATGAEGPILDGGFGHPAPDGGYHYHANPRALRLQLGDNLSYNATTDTYTEATTNLHHSPILGWAYDGYPIYGPYAYSNATNAGSAVRRMGSGHAPRDGSYGTTNLTSGGRHSLAPWAAFFSHFHWCGCSWRLPARGRELRSQCLSELPHRLVCGGLRFPRRRGQARHRRRALPAVS